MSIGFVPMMRGEDGDELIAKNPLAFTLAAVIARRARWHDGFNRHGLSVGEAFLGDHNIYGMSEQQYRTAKATLQAAGFATFRRTQRGTIAKLADTRLFDVLRSRSNGQTNGQNNGQANDLATTNEEGKEQKKGRESGKKLSPPSWEEVKAAAQQMEMAEEDARVFYLDHTSTGWILRGSPIVDWVARLHAWKIRGEDYAPPH